MKYGLLPLPPDPRDLSVGAVFTLPALEDLPDDFALKTLEVKNQGESDFCSAYSSCTVSEIQEGVKLEPSWSFAISKTLSGDAEAFGQDLRTMMKAHVKFGAIEEELSPLSVDNKNSDYLRHIENWPPELRQASLWHKKASFMDCKGPYDAFDNIRACMWKFRKEKRAVVSGLLWGWPIETERINDIGTPEGGHAIAYIGWQGECLRMQNSYGKNAGRNGVHLVRRSVVNKYVDMYGAFMFQDIKPEEARWYKENGKKADRSWVINLLASLFGI